MVRVVIVPGLAVRSYAVEATDALLRDGLDAQLEEPPGWPSRATDLDGYGRRLATTLARESRSVDLLVGLSVGTQAAAVAATHVPVGHLLLVSPTVPPELRSEPRLLARFLRGEDHRDSPAGAARSPIGRKPARGASWRASDPPPR